MIPADIRKPLVAEFVGSALLLAAVVGSGIMGERLAGGNLAIALLANSIATGAVLVALILTLGPISGAHFNPAVSVADASQGRLPWAHAGGYVAMQIAGALVGVAVADVVEVGSDRTRRVDRARRIRVGRVGRLCHGRTSFQRPVPVHR